MRKALTLRMFPETMPTLRRVDLAHAAGYDGVEVHLEPWFARFLDEIDSPWVGACFDTGNAQWYGFPEHWIPALGARIRRVHLKDNRLLGSSVVSTPLLAGRAPAAGGHSVRPMGDG